MKKYSILLFLALLVQTHIIAQCDFDNPLEDIEWMEMINPNSKVIEYDYLGETVFFFEDCLEFMDIPNYTMYDCEGNILCMADAESPGIPCDSYYPDLTYVETWQVGIVACVEYDCAMIPFGDSFVDPCGECLTPSEQNSCNISGTVEAEETNIACNGTEIALPTYTTLAETVDYLILDEQDLILVDTPNMIYEPRIVGVISGDETTFKPLDYGFLEGETFSIATVGYNLQSMKGMIDAINPADCENTCCSVLTGATGVQVCGLLCNYYGICSGEDVYNFQEVIDFVTVFGAEATILGVSDVVSGFNQTINGGVDLLPIVCPGLYQVLPLYVVFSENTITYTCSNESIIECTDPNACNYNPTGSTDIEACFYPDCEGNCNGALTGTAEVGKPCDDGNDNTVNDVWTENCNCLGSDIGLCLTAGCTDMTACNYDADASVDDGTCYFDCPTTTINETICNVDTFFYELGYADFEYAWVIYEQPQNGTLIITEDNLDLEYVPTTNSYGGDSFIIGHYSPIGDNYDSFLQFSIAVLGYCDFGCTDATACNYNPNNTGEDGICYLPDCAGICGGLSVYDDCGECLLPDDPDFNDCNTDCTFESAIDAAGYADFILETHNVIEYKYINETVFFIEICESAADGLDYMLIDCQGNILCQYGGFSGGEGCGEFTNDMAYIQTLQQASINCVTYDCNNIPFGEDICNADQDVWAGDVNYNGIVNNEDVLYVGLKYGTSGSPRPNASIAWEAQLGDDWDDWQNNGENTKHADCDGDGTVAFQDMNVIDINYNLTHEVGKTNADGIPIYVELPNELNASETIELSIFLGDEEMTLEDFHGIAFTLEFPNEYVEEGSVSFDFDSELLGNENENIIGLDKVFHSDGRVDIGIAKIDMQSVNGHGQIATMSLVMIDDIIGKEDSNLPFTITITNITALNSAGATIEVADTTIESEINTGLNENVLENTISIYPNPTTDYLYIDSENQLIESVEIFNIQGQKIQVENNQTQKIDVQQLPNGTYFLSIQTQEGVLLKKVQIMR